MAAHAIRGTQGVVIVDVALGAGSSRVRSGQGKAGGGVVEGSHIGPGNRIVALRAVCDGERRSRSGMHWIVCLLPRREVATGVAAIRGRDLEIVIVIDVAARAGDVGMAVR